MRYSRAAVFLLAWLSVMLFFGCESTPASEPTPTANPSLSPALTPSASPAPTDTPAPTATPFAINPIHAFYAAWEADCAERLDAYEASLSALHTSEGLTYSLVLSEHRALLSEGRVTVARLQGSDSAGYSGTLQAAAEGSGTIAKSANGAYAFSFAYLDETTLVGTFDGESLSYTVYDAEGSTLYCEIKKAADGWSSTACTEELKSELTIPAEGEIAFGLRPGNHIPATTPTATRAAE